ncbi:putative reverse transcriptase domain-containing protein [Tanacetum coccineum]
MNTTQAQQKALDDALVASVDSDSDTSPKKKPVQATKGTRLKSKAKVAKPDKKKQPAKKTRAKGLDVLFEVGLTGAEQMESVLPREQETFYCTQKCKGSVNALDIYSHSFRPRSGVLQIGIRPEAHDPDYVPEPIYPEYIPLEDEHEFLAEEQPLPPVDSQLLSHRYVTESIPEEGSEEVRDMKTEDGPDDYPIGGGDDGDDDDGDSSGDDTDDEDEDDEEEDERLAPADSAVVVPTVEPVSPPEGTEPVIPPPSTDISTTRARITVRLQASISLPPEAEVERLLAMTTPSPSPPISLSPPSAGERLARCTAPPAHSSPPPVPSPLLPSSGCPTQIQTLGITSTQALIDAVTTALPSPPLPPLPPSLYIPPPVDRRDDVPESELPPRKRLCLSTLGSRYEIRESSTARPTRGRGVDYGFVSTVDAEARRQGISEVGYGIRDTWVDPAEAVPEVAPMTVGEVNTRVTELAELHERDTQDLYALLEDVQYRDIMDGGGGGLCFPRGLGSLDRFEQTNQTIVSLAMKGNMAVSKLGAEAAKTSGTITGTLYIDDRTVFVLFDTGATHSIISTTFAKKLNMTPTPLIERVIISTPMKNHMLIDHEYVNCPLRFDDRIRPANLLPIHMLDFDVILGMDWLASHRATIDCYARTVIFGRTLISHGVAKVFLGFCFENIFGSPNIENLSVVREFADVFPDELPGLFLRLERLNLALKELYAKVFESASSRLQQVAFLRHIVSADGSLSDPSKVEAIHQMDDDLLPVTGREFWEIEMEIGSAPYWTLPSVPVVFDIQFDDDRKVWGCVLIAHGKGRWLELLKDYDTNFQYHPGNQINVVADVNLNVQRFGNEYFWWNGILKQDVATRWGSPMWKWDEISMDFVTGLPTTQKRHDAIWVVVDRLTKSAHFLPIRKNYGISKLAEIFRQEIVRLHGTPTSIVSDRDPKFTSRFWKGLQKAWGTRLKFSTAISSPPRWSSERTFNLGRYVEGIWHASIKAAPFELLYGRKCRAPICWDEVGERLIEGPELIEITNEESGCLLRRIERGFQGQAQSSIHWFVEILERIRERFGNRTVASSASLSCGFRSRGSDFDIPVVFSLIIALLRNKAQMVETLRVMRDIRREMGDMQTELLTLRGQQRARQPAPDARIPYHQDTSGDADNHV